MDARDRRAEGLRGWFETSLWSCRLAILVAVLACVVSAVAILIVATAEVAHTFVRALAFARPSADGASTAERAAIVAAIIEAVDEYLLAAMLWILALGLYGVFIGRLAVAGESQFSRNLLLIHSVDDLKARLASIVMLVLVVRFFGLTMAVTVGSPSDLVALAAAIVLIAGALALSRAAPHGASTPPPPAGETPSARS